MTIKVAKGAKLQSVATLAAFRLGVRRSALLYAQHGRWAPNVANIAYLKNLGDLGDLGDVAVRLSESFGRLVRTTCHGRDSLDRSGVPGADG
jgi:hypothetical protein